MIYEQRPIACREHLVIGPASGCVPGSTDQTQVVQMPFSLLEALAQLTSEIEHRSIETIILPFALPWCYSNPEYARHTWPARQLVRHFINILTGEDLAHLNGLPKLRGLTVAGDITNTALASLTGPLSLRSLTVYTDEPTRRQTSDRSDKKSPCD